MTTPVPQLTFTSRRTQVGPSAPPIATPLFDEEAAPALPFAPGLFGRGVAATDVDGDGAPDFIIATGGGAVIYRNAGAQGFVDETSLLLPAAAQGSLPGTNLPVVGDLNGDGRVDLILLVEGGLGDDLVFFGTVGGTLVPGGSLPSVDAVSSEAVLVDVDSDGDLDVVRSVGTSGHATASGRDSLCLNNGSGVFTESMAFRNAMWNGDSIPTTGVAALDANGDGNVDLFFTRADSGSATGSPGAWNILVYGQGNGQFVDASSSLPGMKDQSYGAVPLDLEGDGDLDLVVCNSIIALGGAASGDVLVNQGGDQGGLEGTYVDRFGSIEESAIPAEAIRLGPLS
ncbi:MAG: VCBS repeat-containing protein, partial [Planctomycetota bacterium]